MHVFDVDIEFATSQLCTSQCNTFIIQIRNYKKYKVFYTKGFTVHDEFYKVLQELK